MVEVAIGYEGEDDDLPNYKCDATDNDGTLNQFKDEINALEEIANKDYMPVGAENIKLGESSQINADLKKYKRQRNEDVANLLIGMTPGKLTRGYYKILNSFGLFNPRKILRNKISTIDEQVKELDGVCSKCEKETNEKDQKLKELYDKIEIAMKTKEGLKAQKESKNPYESAQATRNLRVVNEEIYDTSTEAVELKEKIEQQDSIFKSLKNAKKIQQNLAEQIKKLYDDASGKSNTAKFNKLFENYAKLCDDYRKNYKPIIWGSTGACGNSESETGSDYIKQMDEELCEAIINITPGRLKRGYYRVLNSLGLFNPCNILHKKINQVNEEAEALDDAHSKYGAEISGKDAKIKELCIKVDWAMKTIDCLEAQKENKNPYESIKASRKIDTLQGLIDDAKKETSRLETEMNKYTDMSACLKEMKQQYKNMLMQITQVYDAAAIRKNIERLNKLCGDYGKV